MKASHPRGLLTGMALKSCETVSLTELPTNPAIALYKLLKCLKENERSLQL